MNTLSKSKSVDMLHGPLFSKIIWFAIPIALQSMLQQLFNLADTAVVGRFADASALAAVGTNTELVALIVTFSSGLAIGVNVRIANFIGRQEEHRIPTTVRISLVFAILFALVITITGQFWAEPVLIAIKTPDSILAPAVAYFRIYLIGYPLLLLYDFGAAVLRSHGDSRRPLIAMTIAGVVNVLFNLFFVIVLHLGVLGVALATDISTALSAAMVLYWLYREDLLSISGPIQQDNVLQKENSVYISEGRIHREQISHELRMLLKIGVPAAIQGSVFCFANIFMQAAVNSFGETEIAGAAITLNFEYFTYYIITAFGQASTTFTGQNYSAGNVDRCRKIARDSIVAAILIWAIVSIPIVIFRYPLAMIFTTDAAVAEASAYRTTFLIFEFLCATYEVLAGSFRGMGHSTLPAVMTIIGTCVFRIVWIETVVSIYHTQFMLYVIFPLSWVASSILVGGSYLLMRKKLYQRSER